MVREKDVCWEYCDKLDGNKVRCRFCLKVLNGGISRLKFHLSRIPSKGVHPCSKVGDDVADRVRAILAVKSDSCKDPTPAPSSKNLRIAEAKPASLPPETSSSVVQYHPPGEPAKPAQDVERCIAEFFFENRLDLSMANSPSYQLMLEAVGGPGFRGPSSESLRTVWLPKLKSEVLAWVTEIEKDWDGTGCSILADSCTYKSKSLVNFSVSSPLGTYFLRSVDASSYLKSQKGLYDAFDAVIQDVGPDNVVQVIVDRPSNYGNVGAQIMQTYGSIFWSASALHSLDSILDDISKIDWVNRCIGQAQNITRFMYQHAWVLELMRKFTAGHDVVRTGVTRSVSDFLTLQSLLKYRFRLKHMFNSPEYMSSGYTNRSHGLLCSDILDDNDMWRAVEEIVAATEPLLKVMRDVAGPRTAMGSIYESMTKVEDSIRTYFIMDEVKCGTLLEIVGRRWRAELHSPLHAAAAYLNPSIQYNPEVKFLGNIKEEFMAVLYKMLPTPELRHDITGQLYMFKKSQGMFGSNLARESRRCASPGMWWDQYGDSAPGLQRAAVRMLSQVCSTSTASRDWSSTHQIHSDKRNRLDKDALADLLYLHYNLKLWPKQPQPVAGNTDPIAHREIDMTSEWVSEVESPSPTQWLDRFPSGLDGGDLNTRQFSSSVFGSNDHIFGL